MKQKGFTLMELLGVIVILAMLMILVFPSVINFIKKSSNKTDQLTLELIYSAADTYISRHKNEFQEKNGNKYIVPLKELVDDGLLISPIKLSNGNDDLTNIKSVQVSYNNGFNYELKNNDDCEIKYSNGSIIYFDVQKGSICRENEYKANNSKTGYNGYTNKDESGNVTEKLDTQSSCLKFYAFNDTGGDTVNLILDHNTTAKVAWHPSSDNSEGPSSDAGYVLESLYNDTKEWIGTQTPNNYVMYNSDGTEKYTVTYNLTPANISGAETAYKARLITANEIAQITGANKVDTLNWYESLATSDLYYLDGMTGTDSEWKTPVASSTNKSNFYWLFDRTKDCTIYGCDILDSSIYGYWTSSVCPTVTYSAWHVNYKGYIGIYSIVNAGYAGVRPVITILK